MKKFVYSHMHKICGLLLAFGFMTHFRGVSFFFFGEPKYPTPEQYEN